ncbi:MAG: oligosaccharide flippase family protein [Calditrichia bacterium]
MSRLVKQAGIVSLGNISRLLVKTIIGFILARIFTKDAYGSYLQLFLIYQIFSTMLLWGIPQSILYFLPKFSNTEKQQKFIIQTLLMLFIFGFLLSIILLLFRHPIAVLFNNNNLPHLLLVFFLYPMFMFITTSYIYFMLGFQKSKKVAFFSIFSVISDAIFILTIAFFTKDVFFTAIGIVISSTIQFVYTIFSLKKFISEKFQLDFALIREQMKYSIPLGMASIVGILSTQLDKLVVSNFFSPELFAVFAIGATEIPIVPNLRNSIFSVVLPEISKLNFQTEKRKITTVYSGSIRKFALILFPLIVFFFVFAPEFIAIAYSEKYLGAVTIFRIYLGILPMRVANYTLVLQAAGITKPIFWGATITLGANLILNIVFVRIFGLTGPAIATVIVNYISLLYYVILIKRRLKFDIAELFAFSKLLKTFSLSIIVGMVFYFFSQFDLTKWIKFPSAFILYMATFIVAGVVTNVITKYDRELFLKFVKRYVFLKRN